MSTEGYKSFAITVRPLQGIADKTVEAIRSWLVKLDFAAAVLEMEGTSRHLHAQIWTNSPKRKGDVTKALQRICERTIEDWDNSQLKVLRMGVKIAYSDWYLDYLIENEGKEDPNIILNNPPSKSFEFYPTEEEQEAVRTVSTAVDPRFADLEIRFHQWFDEQIFSEIKIVHVAKFLAIQANVERTMKVTIHKKDRTALCQSLYNYIKKSDDPSEWLPLDRDQVKFEKNVEKLLELTQNA